MLSTQAPLTTDHFSLFIAILDVPMLYLVCYTLKGQEADPFGSSLGALGGCCLSSLTSEGFPE